MLKCMYCGDTNNEMYVVREAVKPKGYPYRWHSKGHCCEKCHEQEGKPVTIERLQSEIDESS